MASTVEVLEAEALQLPAADRARLVERLIASLDMDPQVEEAWAAEVERRNAEIESGAVSLIPGPEAQLPPAGPPEPPDAAGSSPKLRLQLS
jgi:putative addiction module component (TIGR02574 family)